ncbi:ANTH domain-containing protein [Entophlyctis helioformis]|nr:ANTH domain-containing protein [Entophlyctis helioformis]
MGSRYGGGYAVEKYEEELAQAIKKALSPDEAAPKQKHVRSCILYTWDVKGAGSFWAAIKTYPMVGDEIVSFKALVTIHKVIRQGHPQVLKAAIEQSGWLDQLARQSGYNSRGYGGLITAYVTYLQTKLQFHAIHPEFSGTFDYEEYVSLRGIDDPNEGYETISELLLLLDKIDAFSKLIFGAVRSMGSSEARVSALVPLVEESHGIYLFIVSMMSAMHQIIGSVEVLAPLREQFKRNHYALVKFYDECSMLKYLTALVTIPKISADAPDFLSQGAPTQQPKKNTNNNNNAANAARKKQEEDEAFMRQQEEMQRKFLEEQEQLERQQAEMERLRQAELARQQEMLRQQELLRQQEQERVRMQMQAQEQQMINSRLLDAHSQLEYFRNQSAQDRNMIEQYSQRVGQLEQQLAQMSLTSSANAGKDDIIKRLQDEIAQWKQKYESLAKLYAQLRKEHLDLLNKFKTIKDAGTKATDEVRREVVRLEAELKAKANELTEALVNNNRARGDTDRIRMQYEEELARLRREIQESKAALNDISSTKGAEVQALVARFTNEQTQLENIIRAKQAEAEEMRRRLDDLLITLERNKAASDEEVAVLQAGLDQALLVLSQQQKESQMGLVTRDDEITKLRNEHRKLLYQMMDNVLNACSTTVMEAVYELDSAAHEGNQTASPEHVLSLMEKAQQNCSEFSASFVRLVNGADPKDAINTSSALAQSVSQLLHNGKGVVRLAPNDADAEDTMRSLRMGADATIDFFNQLKSTALALIASDQQAVRIVELSRATQHHVGRVGPIVEKLSQSKLQGTLEGDLGDAVERELGNAARAIDEATRRMQELLARSGPDLNVHSAILQAALAITTAIANLIRCATASQQEIVAHGKGSTTKGAFYKKNNKWTEGLVSAAQSVAVATTYLVEVADGLVQGTHSLEQLAVAAQEVSVATTQLVAAARVKAVPLSKTHDRLEEAASAVREATKLLVRAAKDAAKLSAESRARGEISQMSKHEAKIREMQQQVRILELEKELSTARFQLGEMRRQGYHEDE